MKQLIQQERFQEAVQVKERIQLEISIKEFEERYEKQKNADQLAEAIETYQKLEDLREKIKKPIPESWYSSEPPDGHLTIKQMIEELTEEVGKEKVGQLN